VGVKGREIDRPVDKEHSEQSVGGRIILKWNLKGQEGRVCAWERDRKGECVLGRGTGRESVCLGEGQVVRCCEDGSEHLGSIRFGKCLEQRRIY